MRAVDIAFYFALLLTGAGTAILGPALLTSLASSKLLHPIAMAGAKEFVASAPGAFGMGAAAWLVFAVAPNAAGPGSAWSWLLFFPVTIGLLAFDIASGCVATASFSLAWVRYALAVAAVLVAATRALSEVAAGGSDVLSTAGMAVGSTLGWLALRGSALHVAACEAVVLPAALAPAVDPTGSVTVTLLGWASAVSHETALLGLLSLRLLACPWLSLAGIHRVVVRPLMACAKRRVSRVQCD